MRRLLLASAAIAGVVALAPTGAQAQYNPGGYSGTLSNPTRVYVTPGGYAASPPPPAPARPFFYNPPGYRSGAYYDYRHFGDPTTQDSLMTCAYC